MDLDPYERWMVRSNLRRIKDGEADAANTVALLRARGYDNIADAVEQHVRADAGLGRVISADVDGVTVRYTYEEARAAGVKV